MLYEIRLTTAAEGQIAVLKARDPRRHKKILSTLRKLREEGHRYPGLNRHKFQNLYGPNGEEAWESYVENRTPGAWRIWWFFGPEAGQITVIDIDKHP